MNGVVVFHSLAEAIKAGYQVLSANPEGYLVRTQTASGWALALVRLRA